MMVLEHCGQILQVLVGNPGSQDPALPLHICMVLQMMVHGLYQIVHYTPGSAGVNVFNEDGSIVV